MKFLKDIFKLEKKPRKNLLALEWVMIGYLLFTLVIIFFCYTKVHNPEAMIFGRVRILITTAAMYVVYRLVPCRFTRLARVGVQLALLGWWYPDTYEINRIFPNLDHLFATWEQALFGFQPALVFSQAVSNRVFSELMALGYVSYFPLIMAVVIYYFIWRYQEFERASLIILASFFIYYVVYLFLPVTGPQYYFGAVGLDEVAHGIFPNLYDYFNHHSERMANPGWSDGYFYHLLVQTHDAGERPTAAFPSSHVGVTTILMLLAWHSGNRRLFYLMLPFAILLCISTVYIMAHYAIDAIAGLLSGIMIYYALLLATSKMKFS